MSRITTLCWKTRIPAPRGRPALFESAPDFRTPPLRTHRLRDHARRCGYQATQSADAGLGFFIFNSRLWMATAKIFIGIVHLGACSA